jgi:hypothetical protein
MELNRSPIVEFFEQNKMTFETNQRGYVDLIKLCSSLKKLYYMWKKKKSTFYFLEALSKTLNIPVEDLIYYDDQTHVFWGHPQVAIRIAEWDSAAVQVQMSQRVFDSFRA